MSRISTEEMQRRLRSALNVEPTEETRGAHLGAIETALAALPVPVVSPSAQIPFRRRFAAATAFVMALSPVSVAVAAEQAVPGDGLYQVKLVTESVRSVVDPLVVARHRVQELETLIDRGSDPSLIQDAITAARVGVESLEDAHALVERLRRVEALLEQAETDETKDEPSVVADDEPSASTDEDREDDDDRDEDDDAEGRDGAADDASEEVGSEDDASG